jgi:hypothetical protein
VKSKSTILTPGFETFASKCLEKETEREREGGRREREGGGRVREREREKELMIVSKQNSFSERLVQICSAKHCS